MARPGSGILPDYAVSIVPQPCGATCPRAHSDRMSHMSWADVWREPCQVLHVSESICKYHKSSDGVKNTQGPAYNLIFALSW